MSTEAITTTQPSLTKPLESAEITKKSPEISPIPIKQFFDGLPAGHTILDISIPENISELRNQWSKKEGKIIGLPVGLNISTLIDLIDMQEPVDAVSMLDHEAQDGEEKILAAIEDKLKPGGMLIATFLKSSGMGRSTADESDTKAEGLMITPDEYRTMVKKFGFKIIGEVLRSTAPETETKPKNFIYEILAQKPAKQAPAAA